ncbi:MAG: SigE family RNA polymerase sigma factor [Actinomycetia bacterium]|nr:SigE family RNA polymerase sigma factor [Actinomycetes bacterium]
MSRDTEFTEFVIAAAPRLRRLATLLAGDSGRGEDLLQESLLKTYLKWNRIGAGSAYAYTRRVMATTNTDMWRKNRHEIATGTYAGGTEAGQHDTYAVEDRDVIIHELARLTPRERAMVVLRYYSDLSAQAVADELGVSVGTVKSTCSRALATLRSRVELEGDLA